MPPFVPRKRLSSEDPPSAKRQAVARDVTSKPIVEVVEFDSDSDSSSDSSLSDAPSSDEFEDVTIAVDRPPKPGTGTVTKTKKQKTRHDANTKPGVKGENVTSGSDSDNDSDSDSIDWEDAIETNTRTTSAATPVTSVAATAAAAETQDLELTLDKNEVHITDLTESKKGPSKIERHIRTQTHCMHVQCLMFHNALRNAWLNDSKIHDILRQKLPSGIRKEVQKWRVASALEAPPQEKRPDKLSNGKKKKSTRKQHRDWGEDSSRLEPGQPDLSRGDPIITLLKVLAAYWKKQFRVTAPGLRKNGYRPMAELEADISSYKKDYDQDRHGERICGIDDFRALADRMEGSRDVGAQLFTALLRALGMEARLVANLQPLGFGWTKAEMYTRKERASTAKSEASPDIDGPADASDSEISRSDESSDGEGGRAQTAARKPGKRFDRDVPFPIYWTEVASPITHEIIPVDPMVLPNAVATTPELQAAFEPRGAKADRAKQVICYVIAHSSDGTAKEVTTRYLRRRTWPGKTKGFRLPVEKIPIPGKRGKYFEYDWFRATIRGYLRPEDKRTEVDKLEDSKDLVPNQPDKKPTQAGDTLQSLRTSTEFVLERFLRREEALRPGAKHVRTFIAGKGDKAKEENVYRRTDVVKCLSAESWHKEGRQVKVGEIPLKRVPIRAVTLIRKREVEELQRETGEKPKQGLYAKYQTEYIIPPPIRDGIIPKNEYGNIDCFVPSMVPRGAVHIPWPATVRICKKLGINYAEAVTGFEFGAKMAVPVIQGVVVAAENEDLVKDAWRVEDAEKRKREQLKAEKRILQTWRKFLFGLRIAERVREEYGGDDEMDRGQERETHNPFTNRRNQVPSGNHATALIHDDDHDDGNDAEDKNDNDDSADFGGGFLLPGEEGNDDDGLILEEHDAPSRHRHIRSERQPQMKFEVAIGTHVAGESELSSAVEELSPLSSLSDTEEDEDEDESEYEIPKRPQRGRGGAASRGRVRGRGRSQRG